MSLGAQVAGARSRLRWFDDPDDAGLDEIPHIAGIPVDGATSRAIILIREWPNRLGVGEPPRPRDRVHWYPLLAEHPPTGQVVARDPSGQPTDRASPPDLDERTAWLRRLVSRLAQKRGIRPAADVIAPCCVVLTPGAPAERASHGHGWGVALTAVPRRLAEFAGGLQLVVTDSVWARREEYADDVLAIMERGN